MKELATPKADSDCAVYQIAVYQIALYQRRRLSR